MHLLLADLEQLHELRQLVVEPVAKHIYVFVLVLPSLEPFPCCTQLFAALPCPQSKKDLFDLLRIQRRVKRFGNKVR